MIAAAIGERGCRSQRLRLQLPRQIWRRRIGDVHCYLDFGRYGCRSDSSFARYPLQTRAMRCEIDKLCYS